MQFEVKIGGNEVFTMRAAGIDMHAYQELNFRVIEGKTKLPAVVHCPYFLSDEPVDVQITVLARGNFKIDVPDENIGRNIRSEIDRFAARERASILGGQPAKNLVHERMEAILEPDGISLEDAETGKSVLSRRAQEALMRLCEEIHFVDRWDIFWFLGGSEIPKADRPFVAQWLLRRFAAEKDPSVRADITGVFINNPALALGELREELAQLIENTRYGSSRSGLLHVLAKIKHPKAAELIASVMDEDGMAWFALRCLGSLKAKQYEAKVRRYLRDNDSEVRLEAKRALKKMGCEVEKAPPPVHLVKGRKSLPKELQEWSSNLDMEELRPCLEKLTECVEEGFGATEVADLCGVAEETRHNQTRTFRFPVKAGGQPSELWVAIFMDDIDSPDLYVHGKPEIIRKFESAMESRA